MTLILRGKSVQIDESLLTAHEAAQFSQFPNGGVVEPWFIPFWESSFKPGDTVLDIGANVGIISIGLALLGGVVHAIEGSPRNAERLQKICKPLRQISVHPVALDASPRKAKTRFNDCIGAEHPEQDVSYEQYDAYAKRVGIADPAFVKMDIEGMETVALHGMKDLVERVRPVWQIEYHPSLPYRYDGYPGFVPVKDGGFSFDTFTKHGYRILNQDLAPVDAVSGDGNYFFLP